MAFDELTPEASAPPKPSSPPNELPPVDPPSARFITQLFVIPFLVVLVVVCFLLVVYGLFGKLAGGGRDAHEYVEAIRSGNENRRWRAAYELASLIHNEPDLAADTKVRDELAELLRDELKKPGVKDAPEAPRFLALALGAFNTLEVATNEAATDPVNILLDALGESAPDKVRRAAAESLSRQAAKPGGLPAAKQDRVATALIAATKAGDSEVRQRSAYALAYFDRPDVRAALAEAVGDPERLVRFNAAAALTRLDDPAGVPVLRQMLSERDLKSDFADKDDPNASQNLVATVEMEAISALQDAQRAGKTHVLRQVAPDLERLSKQAARQVQVEARNLLHSDAAKK